MIFPSTPAYSWMVIGRESGEDDIGGRIFIHVVEQAGLHPQLTSPFLIRLQTREATTVWGWARMWTSIVVRPRVGARRQSFSSPHAGVCCASPAPASDMKNDSARGHDVLSDRCLNHAVRRLWRWTSEVVEGTESAKE